MTTIIDTSIIYSPHWEQSTAAAQKQKEKPMDGHTYPKDSLLAPAAALKKIPTGQHLYITDGAALVLREAPAARFVRGMARAVEMNDD